jgi:hypothetical protein
VTLGVRESSPLSQRTRDVVGLLGGLVDEYIASHRIRPPPTECCIETETEDHCKGKDAVDDGHPSFGHENRVAELPPGARLAGRQSKHDDGGHRGPDDPERHGRRHDQTEHERRKCDADEAERSMLALFPRESRWRPTRRRGLKLT